jgi:hypothetical protein
MEDDLKKNENGRRPLLFWKTRMRSSKKIEETSTKIKDDLKQKWKATSKETKTEDDLINNLKK